MCIVLVVLVNLSGTCVLQVLFVFDGHSFTSAVTPLLYNEN